MTCFLFEYVTLSVKSKVSKSNYEKTSIKFLFDTINFTIISNFDMTLLSQY